MLEIVLKSLFFKRESVREREKKKKMLAIPTFISDNYHHLLKWRGS